MPKNARNRPGKPTNLEKAERSGKHRWCPDCALRGALNGAGMPVKNAYGERMTSKCEACLGSGRVYEWDSW